jgi:predicted MFS family arabinose efflux permease
LFNAVTSLSSAIGAALGGVIFDRIGFTGLVWITFLVVFVALGLNLLWRSGWERAIAPVLSTARAR